MDSSVDVNWRYDSFAIDKSYQLCGCHGALERSLDICEMSARYTYQRFDMGCIKLRWINIKANGFGTRAPVGCVLDIHDIPSQADMITGTQGVCMVYQLDTHTNAFELFGIGI